MDILGDSDSDNNDNVSQSLTINKNYARSYEKWRKKEERQKLIDKYGEDVDSESSSSEEEEIRSTPQMDKDWLRAYAVVRFNQPRLYSGEQLFQGQVEPVKKKNEKVETLKDYERRFILEKGGVESDDDSDGQLPEKIGKTYFEEQQEIKDSIKAALHDSDSGGDEEDEKDSLLVKKIKTREQQSKEENEYLEWLKGERDDLEDEQAAAELAPLKEYWNNPNLDEKERVLRDYILNNGYMDREEYSEDDSESDDGPAFGEEEEFLDKAEEYEQKYNFRHEEPGGSEIKSYPRVIETSVRVKDNRRAEKRQRRLDKKNEEKTQRQEEVRLLQKLQREAKEEKLRKLRELSENPELNYDLDADFDPEEHSKIMRKYFNEDYYGDEDHGKKPVFEYDEAVDDDTGDADEWWKTRSEAQRQEEEEEFGVGNNMGEEEFYDEKFIMDADYDANTDYKAKTKKEKKKDKKKKGKSAIKKPAFDPSSKSFDEFVGEYLKDKISTLPFPYREVMPNNFGLSTEEIFTAPDRELNSWVSVKKMSMYRSNYEERMEVQNFEAKAKNLNSKYKKLPSLLVETSNEAPSKKKKKKKKKKRDEDVTDVDEPMTDDLKSSMSNHTESVMNGETLGAKRKSSEEAEQSPNKKKKRKLDEGENSTDEISTQKKKKAKSSECLTLAVKQKNPLEKKKGGQKKMLDKVNAAQISQRSNSNKKKMEDKETKKKVKRKKKSSALGKAVGELKPDVDSSQGKVCDKLELKNKKLKKSKLYLDPSSTPSEQKNKSSDKKTNKEDLKKMMSSYRLCKYGFGPTVTKDASQLKKKKKKRKMVDS